METHQKSVEWGLSVLFIIALTYGASVEAFRSFDPHHPTFPASDAESYIRLAQGNHNVFITHRYRVIIPYLAGRLGEILPSSSGLFSGPQIDSELRLKRSFYVVNLAFTIFTACLLLAFLRAVGFDAAWAHVGVAIFLCSSVTSYSTACCLVDSGYYLGIITILLLTIRGRIWLLTLLAPLLVVLKEPTLLFLLIPCAHTPKKAPSYLPFLCGVIGLFA